MKLVSEQPPTTPELVAYLRHTPACPGERDPEITERGSVTVIRCPDCGAGFPDHQLGAGPESTWDPVIQWHRQIEQRRHEDEQLDKLAAARAKTPGTKR